METMLHRKQVWYWSEQFQFHRRSKMSNHTNFFEFDSTLEFESNFNHSSNDNDQSASVPMITLYLTNLILVTLIGCPLHLVIIHYERFGCDPQKRSLLICTFLMVGMIILNLFLGLRILMGPLDLWLADACLATLIIYQLIWICRPWLY